MKLSEVDEAVTELCYALLHDTERWTIRTHTLVDRKTGIEYWTAGCWGAITQIWDGGTTHDVFTTEQGMLVYQAFDELCSMKASTAQEKVVQSLKNSTAKSPWYKFW